MALFIDGGISTVDDLRAYDSSILEVSSAEGVELSPKLGLAETELGIELVEFLRRKPAGLHNAGAGVSLGNVVVTPGLKQWHTLRTLSLVYGDVRGNHTSDRYEEKYAQYTKRARWAADLLLQSGLGMTANPVNKAARPVVASLPGELAGETYYVRVAWKNHLGDTGALSDVVLHTVLVSGLFSVGVPSPPESATGFDVYAGLTEDGLMKQNEALVAPGAEWVLPVTGLVAGTPPGDEQEPEWFLRNERVFQRG